MIRPWLLILGLTGCSFFAVRRPGTHTTGECTTSYTMPVVDAAVVTTTIIIASHQIEHHAVGIACKRSLAKRRALALEQRRAAEAQQRQRQASKHRDCREERERMQRALFDIEDAQERARFAATIPVCPDDD